MRQRILVVFLIATACSGSTMTPNTTPGQVAIVGDSTFRTRDAGSIDVNVKRRFAAHEASGSAVLHNMTLDVAQTSPLVGVAATRAWLSIENVVVEPTEAYEVAQRAIDELGTAYRDVKGPKHVIDDTGNSIVFAKTLAAKGDYATAAKELTSVVRDRLAMYLRVFSKDVE